MAPTPSRAMNGLSNLDFNSGLSIQAMVKQRFGSSVSPISVASGFHLVASFSRAAIRINVDSASLILEACLGGKVEDFRVL